MTAVIVAKGDQGVSLSAVFEKFLVDHSNRDIGPRMRNSILVNQRKQELSISAGGMLDDVYAFSHSNSETNSVFIILYLGPSKTLENGRKLLQDFKEYLSGKAFDVKDYIVTTSDDDAKAERDSEMKITSTTASFALDLLCSQKFN